MHIFDILEELRRQVGKGSAGRKMAILEAHKDNKLLKDFFFWCYDPKFTYGQTKIDKSSKYCIRGEDIGFLDAMNVVFDQLENDKVTGNAAKAILTGLYCSMEPKDACLLEYIITGKPGVGFNISTVNKIWPKLIYDPAYMRCKGFSKKLVEGWDFVEDTVYSQVKADGMFSNIFLGDTAMETRNGMSLKNIVKTFSSDFQLRLDFIKGFLGVVDPVIHGELVVWKDGVPLPRSKSNGLINEVKLAGGDFPIGHKLKIVVWDYIPKKNFDDHLPYKVPYKRRLKELETAIDISGMGDSFKVIDYKEVNSLREAQEHFVECLQKGMEGTVLKHGDGIWKNHDSPNQLKFKNKFRFEMRVKGFTEGEGKYAKTFGSMIIASECGELKSAISGMTDKVRNMIHENRDEYLDGVVEIEANGLFQNDDGSYGIMHPRYKHLRKGKNVADTLIRIVQQEIDSITGKEIGKY